MSDPTTISTDQIRAAYDALGLDPERFEDVMRIYIGPDECAVERVTHPTPHERVTSIASIPFAAVAMDEPSFPFEVFDGSEEPAPTEDAEVAETAPTEEPSTLELAAAARDVLATLAPAFDAQPAESPANARWIP